MRAVPLPVSDTPQNAGTPVYEYVRMPFSRSEDAISMLRVSSSPTETLPLPKPVMLVMTGGSLRTVMFTAAAALIDPKLSNNSYVNTS